MGSTQHHESGWQWFVGTGGSPVAGVASDRRAARPYEPLHSALESARSPRSPPPRRSPMAPRAHSLDPLFHPNSVAVVGASATPGSVGSILMRNLLENPFGGVVYPVNPKRAAVHGVHCYPDLAHLPETVDLAVIATPALTVSRTLQACL